MGYTIRALGPLQIERNGQPIEGFAYNKVRALLLYLACEPRQVRSRATLCALLWPDQPEAAARQSLSQALTQLRKVLGSDVVKTTVQTVALNVPITVDALSLLALSDDCERHAHHAWRTCAACAERLAEAVSLYRGDFLGDFFLSDSASFEEWALGWRELLRQRVLSACGRLVDRHVWSGELARAIDVARRRVSLDPLGEAGQRELMRLLAGNGERPAAEAQGESLRRILRDELDAPPEPETEALLADIRAGRDVAGGTATAPTYGGPRPAHRLIGRADLLTEVLGRLRADDVRAVTLTGAPGIGKTRLALEAAQALVADFVDGVHVVELATVEDAGLFSTAILQVLGVAERPEQTHRAAVIDHLRRRQALLVLDNFEHILDAAFVVAEILAACPHVKVLTTSRAPLNIRFEHQIALTPLADEAAVDLFIERAQAATSTFAARDADPAMMAAVVARVDNLPLAIELVAVRVRALNLQELQTQLDRRLPLLTGGARDLPARQRTLRDAIAWSHDRLALDEQRFFASLGVFVGGFTTEAAEAVAGADALAPLTSLVDNSLVQRSGAEGASRYTVLETVREFALEALHFDGGFDAAQARHAAYFAGLAETAGPMFLGPKIGLWMSRIESELPNIRAAVAWCRGHDVGLGLRLVGAVNRFWYARGHMREAHAWFEDLLALATAATVSPQDLAVGLTAAGVLAHRMSDNGTARQRLEAGLALYEQIGDRSRYARTLSNIGNVLLSAGDVVSAEDHYRRNLALHEHLDEPWSVASGTNNLGEAVRQQGRYAEAAALFEDCIARYLALEDESSAASSMTNLASVRIQLGDVGEARRLCERALTLLADGGDLYRIADSRFVLASAQMRLGDLAAARDGFSTCARLASRAQDNLLPLYALVRLGEIEWIAGRWPTDHLIELLAMTAQRLTVGHVALEPDHQQPYERLNAVTRAAVSPEAFEAAWNRGLTRTIDEALAWLPD